MPNDQTLYFGLPECDLTMDQLLDHGMAVSGQESPHAVFLLKIGGVKALTEMNKTLAIIPTDLSMDDVLALIDTLQVKRH